MLPEKPERRCRPKSLARVPTETFPEGKLGKDSPYVDASPPPHNPSPNLNTPEGPNMLGEGWFFLPKHKFYT